MMPVLTGAKVQYTFDAVEPRQSFLDCRGSTFSALPGKTGLDPVGTDSEVDETETAGTSLGTFSPRHVAGRRHANSRICGTDHRWDAPRSNRGVRR